MSQTMSQLNPEATLGELLTRAAAKRPQYGKKWECPACGKPTLSVDEDHGLFHCFHAGCDFKGNTATLARSLGLALPKMSPVERRRRQERERRLDERVNRTLGAKHERRQWVIASLTNLYRWGHTAHVAGPDSPRAWDILATVYRERLRLTAELLILDNARGPDLERFLGLSRQSVDGDRDTAIDNVVMLGGMYDRAGKFVPLAGESLAGTISDGGPAAPGWLCEMVAPQGSRRINGDGTYSDASGEVIRFRW